MPTLPVVSTLMDAVMNELRIPVTNLTERTKIQSVMSYVYGDICAKQDWWWLEGFASGATQPKITGTLQMFANSGTFLLSTAPTRLGTDALVLNNVFYLDGVGEGLTGDTRFYVNTHSSAGSLSVNTGLQIPGVTSTSVSYTMYEEAFTLNQNVSKVYRVQLQGDRFPLQRIGMEDMERLRMQHREGRPEFWSVYGFATDATTFARTSDEPRMLQFYPSPDKVYPFTIALKKAQQGDLSDIAIPIDYQQVLVYGTLARAYTIFLNDTERGSFFTSLFNDVMALMAAQQREYASDHPGVNPQPSAYRRTNRRFPVATSLGRYFDTYPYNP